MAQASWAAWREAAAGEAESKSQGKHTQQLISIFLHIDAC